MWVLQQVAECGAEEIGGGAGDPDGFYTSMLSNGDVQSGYRQIESLGKQAEAGLIGPSFHRRRGHSEPQDTVDLADDRVLGCLRLQADTKRGGCALLPDGNHQRRVQASSWRDGTSHRWMNWSARIAMMGEMSIPNRHIGIIC